MPHLHLNAVLRRNLFNWLTRLPGYDARWRLMKRFAKAWRIKELDRQADDYAKQIGREIVAAQVAMDAPNETGEKPSGVARFDLNMTLVDLQQKANSYPMFDVDLPSQQYQIDSADLKSLWDLTAPLRAEPKDKDGAKAEGARVGDPCKACGVGGTALAGHYEIFGGICEAIEEAYEAAQKDDRPCPTCRDRSKLRAVEEPEAPVAALPASPSDGAPATA